MDGNAKKDWEAINKFIVDLDCIVPLQQYCDELNIFNVLDLKRTEIRHSNMLAWLLNPYKQHGFGDKFLKRVLIASLIEGNGLSPVDIELMDLSDVIVSKEVSTDVRVNGKTGRIDILLTSKSNKLICAIENKIDSNEHDDQLIKYKEFLNSRNEYNGWKRVLIYLTPVGDAPSDNEWIPLKYNAVCNVLENLLLNYEISHKARIYIEDYKELIRREIMVEDEKLKQACEKIYAQHTEALELLYQYIKEKKEENAASKYIWDCLKEHEKDGSIKVWGRCASKDMLFTPKNFLSHYNLENEAWNSNNYLLGVQVIYDEKKGHWYARFRINQDNRYPSIVDEIFQKAKKTGSTQHRNQIWRDSLFKGEDSDFEQDVNNEIIIKNKVEKIVQKAIEEASKLII